MACQTEPNETTKPTSGAKNRVQRYCPRLKDIKFELECEWDDCDLVLTDMDEFLNHIDEHLATVQGVECKWRQCDTEELATDADLKRHVRFHAFHAKLKQIGNTKTPTLNHKPI